MVISTVNQVIYNGDGVTTAWPYTFRIIDATDIKLAIIDADETETEITADYYVDTVNNTVYYPGYAPGAEPPAEDQPPVLPAGKRLLIYRQLPITQEKDLGEKWPFEVIELALDKLTMILQQIYEWWGRCLKISPVARAEHPNFDMTFPVEAGKSFRVNAEGTGFEAREALMEVNGAWDGEGRQIHSVADPTGDQDAATKNYVDTLTDNNFMKLQPDGTAWEGRNLPISNVANPVLQQQATTKNYVDSIIAGIVAAGNDVIVVDNVATMKATDLTDGMYVTTAGYHEVNDGGNGLYAIRAAQVGDVDDGGSVIILDNGNVAELITDGTVNVKQFGAKGNANYHNLADGNWYESIDMTSAQTAPYIDNVTTEYYKNYGSAVFETEGTYLNPADGKHYVNYDSDSDTYSDEAPYHDNVEDKWYVTATYSDPANAYADGVWYYGAVFSVPAQDDTSYIQNAINFCGNNKCNLEFVKAKYVNTALTITKQFIIDGNGAILAKPNLKIAPYNMTTSQMKWVQQMSVSYSGADDSELMNIRNLEFDNNCWCMWKKSDGYAQEQACCLYVTGGNENNPKAGRLNVLLENLYFHDSPSDGIHLRINLNATVLNCRSMDCFRGGLTMTGGYCNISVDGFVFSSPHTNDGIDLEVDGPGYGGSKAVNVHINNIDIDDDFDLGVNVASTVYVNNLRQRGYGGALGLSGKLYMRNSFVRMADETFHQCMYDGFYGEFENVVFDGSKKNGTVGKCFPNAYITVGSSQPKNGSLVFKGCTFQNGTDGICGSQVTYNQNISVIVDSCIFKDLTGNAIGGKNGNVDMKVPYLYVKNCLFDIDENTGVCFMATFTDTTNYFLVKMENNTYKKASRLISMYKPLVIINEQSEILLPIKIQNGGAPICIGKRLSYVSSIPTIAGINTTSGTRKQFEDYATDGETLWKYSGSGTTWNVVS